MLMLEDGTELGTRSFNAAVWQPGDRIPMGADLTLIVVEFQPAEHEGEPAVLIVAEA